MGAHPTSGQLLCMDEERGEGTKLYLGGICFQAMLVRDYLQLRYRHRANLKIDVILAGKRKSKGRRNAKHESFMNQLVVWRSKRALIKKEKGKEKE